MCWRTRPSSPGRALRVWRTGSPAADRLGPLFGGSLSAASQRQAMGIVAGLFTYLVNAGYLAGNPWTLRRRKHPTRARRIERYLDHAQWAAVLEFIETRPTGQTRERQHSERARWVLRLLYHTALRVSEAANARVTDLVRRRGKWWLRVRGKGGVEGEVRSARNSSLTWPAIDPFMACRRPRPSSTPLPSFSPSPAGPIAV